MKCANREAVQDLVITVLALAGFLYTYTFKRPGSYALQSSVSGAVWPRFLLGGIAVLSCLLMVQEIRKQKALAKQPPRKSEATAEIEGRIVRRQAYARLCWLIVILAAQAGLTPVLGFLLSTLLAQVAVLYLLGMRRKRILVGVPPVVMAIVYAIFIRALNMSLPRGIGPFLNLSRFLY